MGDENLPRALGDYSRPSHEGYRNTIELPDGNNVFFPPGRTTKLRNDISMFQQHHGESLFKAWTRFKDLLQKVPHHGIYLWLQVQIFYDHVNPATREAIDHSVGGKLHDKSAKESWELIENLALYDHESWNDLSDLAKPVKAISLPQDIPINKIASSCDIYGSPHNTQIFMENPEQAFVDYASSCTDEAGDARFSKFEADFKQQQSEMTNKIDTLLKAINDRMIGALPSDTVKNPKLNVNSTSLVSSACSYLIEDPQSSSLPFNSVNVIKTCFKSTSDFQKSQLQDKTLMVNKIETPKSKEPERALEDEFKDLHLKLPLLEVLAHAPMYNAILDKYVESLELCKNGSAFIQDEMPKENEGSQIIHFTLKKTENVLGLTDGTRSYLVGILKNVEVHVGKLKLLEDFYVIDMEKDPTCPLLVGRGFLATASAITDYKKSKIAVHLKTSHLKKSKIQVFILFGKQVTRKERTKGKNAKKRVPFEQRNEPPAQPKVVYAPILDINYFRHFLDILENYNPMDDEPMWAADRVVALTPGFVITIPETANEFTIKGNHLTLIKGNQFDGRIKTDPHKHIYEVLGICDMFKYRDKKNEAVRLMMFPLSLTGEEKTWLDELNEGTIEMWDKFVPLLLADSFPYLFSIDSSEKSHPFLNMKMKP
ncbi:MAK10-like protein [Tanacetum coccineum]|uniref:MAK10-like protein n=1 Tax=Tanacetum coccineum TaxID=301880 RepID=A0ABQ5J4U8_9ASTR